MVFVININTRADNMKKEENKEYIVNGKVLNEQKIKEIIEIVKIYHRLDLDEVVKTICVIMRWNSYVRTKKEVAVENLLILLSEKGLIKLPKKLVKKVGNWNNNCYRPVKEIIPMTKKTSPREEYSGTIDSFYPAGLEMVNSPEKEALWNEYVERYHELKYGRPFGDRIKYLIVIGGEKPQYAGCMLFSASSWALEERDKWIGWTTEDKEIRLRFIVNNTRFLIFPWIKIKNLASFALARAVERIRLDWQKQFRYEPVLLETFVDGAKYTGASYKAANWIYMGETKGRGRQDRYNEKLSSPKHIYMYPLVKDFRDYLTGKKSDGDMIW